MITFKELVEGVKFDVLDEWDTVVGEFKTKSQALKYIQRLERNDQTSASPENLEYRIRKVN